MPPAHGSVHDLAWLAGDWVAERAGTKAEVASRWKPAEDLIERQFTVTQDGKPVSLSTEIIAWDPLTRQIRSWTFSSDGGRAEGTWHPMGNAWVVVHRGVMADGTPTISTDLWAHLLGDAIGWRSVQRSVGGQPVREARTVVLKKSGAADSAKQSMNQPTTTQPPHASGQSR